ncbi:MAG: PAS domain-containing protein, partial [Roseibacillus sp.]|nr:PAS domain-containing protein [Roseibacillus sp.]
MVILLVITTSRLSRERRQATEEKKRLEQEHENALILRESQSRGLLNALSDPFFLLDPEGIIRYANSPAEELFPGGRIVDRHLDEVFLDGRLAEPIREAATERRAVTTQVILSQQSATLANHEQAGETAWLVDAAPVEPDNPDSPLRVTIRNTTAEHHTDQVRKDFVANASHELRTPLAIIN